MFCITLYCVSIYYRFTMLLVVGLVLIIGSFQVHGDSITPNEEKAPPVIYFLPNDISPSTYNVSINVTKSLTNPTGPQSFEGSVIIFATTNIKLKTVTLHAAHMTDLVISVKLRNEELYKAKSEQLHAANESLTFDLVKEVQANSQLTINITYTALLHTDMHGFYVSSYMEGKTNKTVLTTQFQPTHARRAFPCFDEPKYKAKFTINIAKPADYKVISNMLPLKVSDTNVQFAETNIMSTYLVAFIVSQFKQRVGNETYYNVWARPEAESQTKVAAYAMKPIIDELDKFTGIKYSQNMKKMDMAALPDFSAGAMENWGCLTYRETALLVDDEVSTNQNIQRVITVIAHEIAHQWFGNLVTLTWWDNTWINEGFARYFEYHSTAAYKPDWEMENQFVVEQHQSIFEVDALEKTTPLTHTVQTPGEINSHFGTISYSKGGSIVRMMEHFLTRDLFKAGLQAYLQKHSFGNTVPLNIWLSLEETSKDKLLMDYTIEKIMTNWVSKPGFPLVTVNITKEGLVSFCQTRFFSNSKAKQITPQYWYIPISYKTSEESNFTNTIPKLWLTPNEPCKLVDVKNNSWFIANTRQAGYYRVNYNQEHWNLLAKALNVSETREKIHKINRAQLIDDAMNLAKAGILPYGTAFNVTDYLLTETDYFPWYSAFRAFRFLLQRYAENSSTGKILREYMKNITVTLVKGKDFSESNKLETQIDVFNKVQALEWSCNLGVEKCVNDAVEQFKKIDKIPKNVRSIVYCTAIRKGKKAEWDLLWTKYLKSNVAAEKVSIINALGCSSDETILNNFLKKSIEGNEIRSQDASYVFSAVYTGTPKGVDIAFKFLTENAKGIIDSYGGMNALDRAVLGIAERLTKQEDVQKLKDALKNPIFNTIRDAALETVEENVNWGKLHEKDIEELLKDRFNSAASLIISRLLMFFSVGFISIYLTKFA